MNIKHAIIAAGVAGFAGTHAFAADLLVEDFEDAVVGYTTSTPEFTDNGGDYFTRTDGSDIGGTYNLPVGSSFFAANDIDGEGAASSQTMTFSAIPIAGFENLMFSIFVAEDDDGSSQDWDADQSFTVDISIDNGPAVTIFGVESTGGTNTEPAVDTDLDTVGDGIAITDTFAQFTVPVAGTGSSADITLNFTNFNAGDEDIGIDQVVLSGTVIPEPLTVTAGLLGVGGIMLRRRSAV
ncbi:MAG: hypothetical protein AAF916_12765 [Planctomycetota bacterium]